MTLKLKPTRKPTKRLTWVLAFALVALTLIPSFLPPVANAQTGQNVNSTLGAQGQPVKKPTKGNSEDEVATIKSTMNKISSVADTQTAFFAKTFEDNESEELSVNLVKKDDPGYQPVEGSKLSARFTGNPYLYPDTANGDTANCLHDPDTNDCVPGTENNLEGVRFVLTEVVYGHEPDVESPLPGGDSGDYNAWVFRNEFNPAVAIYLTARNDSGDEKHLVFYKTCDGGIIEDGNQASQIDWGGEPGDPELFDPPLHHEDDRDKVQETIDAYATNGKGKLCDQNNSFFNSVMQWVLTAMKDMIDAVLEWIKDALLNVFDIGTLSDNQGLVNAWKTIRDFVNLIFILLLSVIAFSNILRVDTERYGLRALLPRLVFAVVAVNFSFMLVQIMTNVAYVIGKPFLASAIDLLRNPPADGSIIDPTVNIGTFLLSFIMVILVVLGFVILFIFFVIRILVIWFLAALSPFVFLFMVLPLSRSIASMWWKNALKWIFMGPIAFVLLYVAAEVISATGGKNDDVNGPDFLLKIAFWLAACVAAVMVPLKLGGEIAQRGLGAAKGSGKLGLKGAGAGLMAAGGTRGRAAAYGLGLAKPKSATPGSRRDMRQQAALEHLQSQTAEGKGIGMITGATEGQRTRARQQILHKNQQEMATIPAMGKRRIAYAHAQDPDKKWKEGDAITDENGRNIGRLSKDEAEFANKQLSSEAAFAELAQSGMATPHLAEAYAKSGLQQMAAPHDPAIGAIERDGSWNQGRADAAVLYASNDDMKKWDHDFLEAGAEAAEHLSQGGSIDDLTQHQQTAFTAMQQLDKSRAAYAATRGHRKSMDTDRQREAVQRFAAAGGFRQLDQQGNITNQHDTSKNQSVIDSYQQSDATIH